jgi:hypothetical protein
MLSKNHIRMFWFAVPIVLSILFGLDYVHADRHKSYPNCSIKEISNFRMCCEEIFHIVINKMGLEVNEGIPKPTILTDDQLALLQYNNYLGFDANEILPYYFHKNNILVIPRYCKLDNLAHEFVHYFQVMYRNENLDFDCALYIDVLEKEAWEIQRWFKTKFMRPRLPQ